ncbi:MAG: c-type cytochrome [Xanthobacteraceae bacterium]
MFKGLFSILSGAVLLSVVVMTPANAADDIASRLGICSACHGANGTPTNPATPIIWGQKENYLYKELHDYHSGERTNAIMSPMVKSFSLDDLRNVADYFAAKTWPASQNSSPAGSPPEGIAMCQACHGQNFEGGPPAPRLAGLNYDYLIGAMHNFAAGKRTNNLDMPGFMKALTDSQREAIAHYLSAL